MHPRSVTARHCLTAFLAAAALAYTASAQAPVSPAGALPAISRAAQSDRFMAVLGQRSAVLGLESGRFQVWAWPLEILHDFHLSVRVDGEFVPAESLLRSITVRPESTTLVFAGDTFSIRETILTPIHQPAALVRLQIETSQPIEPVVAFQPDLQLEWPGSIGGTDLEWSPDLHAYITTELQNRFESVVGSPNASPFVEPYPLSYAGPHEAAISLGVIPKGSAERTIVMAAALGHPQDAEHLFQQLSGGFDSTLASSRQYYQNYLRDRVQLTLPDPLLQEAFLWSEIGMAQSIVDNPFLGRGLIAGYNVAGDDERPGFAWFFGRDSLWTALALDDIGDPATARDAIRFIARYQRADGKIPHEISQSASFLPWFTATPFAWAAADATPLYIIAVRDYVQRSGDVQFAAEQWDRLQKAGRFLVSTYGPDGLALNLNVGSGWIEAGPLEPIRAELYQSGLGVEAVRSLAELAGLLHKDDLRKQLDAAFAREQPILNQTYWIPGRHAYSLGTDLQGHVMNTPSVLSTVPMEFGLLDPDKVQSTIDVLAAPDSQTDWGMRIISSQDPRYDPGGYHNGSVWPLFTGWASLGEYRYHRALAGYSNLLANAGLTGSASLGHVPEVLSGNYFQKLSTGTPDQTWSAAMVASPLLRGLFGLRADAAAHTLVFAPHIPADWTSFSIGNLRVGSAVLSLAWSKTPHAMRLQVARQGEDPCAFEFSPALSLRARVTRVLLDGRSIPFRLEPNAIDQHLTVRIAALHATDTVTIELADDFGLTEELRLPLPGSSSQGTRVSEERWSPGHDLLTLEIAGPALAPGELKAWDAGEIASIDGASLVPGKQNVGTIQYRMPDAGGDAEAHLEVTIHFREESKKGRESRERRNPRP